MPQPSRRCSVLYFHFMIFTTLLLLNTAKQIRKHSCAQIVASLAQQQQLLGMCSAFNRGNCLWHQGKQIVLANVSLIRFNMQLMCFVRCNDSFGIFICFHKYDSWGINHTPRVQPQAAYKSTWMSLSGQTNHHSHPLSPSLYPLVIPLHWPWLGL